MRHCPPKSSPRLCGGTGAVVKQGLRWKGYSPGGWCQQKRFSTLTKPFPIRVIRVIRGFCAAGFRLNRPNCREVLECGGWWGTPRESGVCPHPLTHRTPKAGAQAQAASNSEAQSASSPAQRSVQAGAQKANSYHSECIRASASAPRQRAPPDVSGAHHPSRRKAPSASRSRCTCRGRSARRTRLEPLCAPG